MDYALKERIGKPELFTGRKEELAYFLKWINDIKEEKSQSTAIRARKKNDFFKSITRYLPADFNFCEYSRAWKYDCSPEYSRSFNINIFALAAAPGDNYNRGY